MDDKHDPNGSVPTGTFRAVDEDDREISVEIVLDEEPPQRIASKTLHGAGPLAFPSTPSPRGAASRHSAVEPASRDSAVDIDTEELHPDGAPRRKRTSTLMGVPLPGRVVANPGPADLPIEEISNAIDAMLDEQPTSVYGALHKRELERASEGEERPTTVYTNDDRPTTSYGQKRDPSLEAMLRSESIARPESMSPGEIIDVVARRRDDTDTYQLDVVDRRDSSKVPVLAPAEFIEARERDSRTEPPVGRDVAAVGNHDAEANARERRRSESVDAARAAFQSVREVPPPVRQQHQQQPSSLAPLEVTRPQPAQAKPAKQRREAASPFGYALVAAMVAIGIGGWWLTAGGYERSQPSAASATQIASAPRPSVGSSAVPALRSMPTPASPETVAAPSPTPPPAAVDLEPITKPRALAGARPVRKAAKTATAAAPAPTEGLVETPARSDVIAGLNGVRSSVQACAEGRSGVAEVDVTIAANGVVTNAQVGGDFGGTPEGSCIARAVRQARFPEFKKDRVRLLYPYAL